MIQQKISELEYKAHEALSFGKHEEYNSLETESKGYLEALSMFQGLKDGKMQRSYEEIMENLNKKLSELKLRSFSGETSDLRNAEAEASVFQEVSYEVSVKTREGTLYAVKEDDTDSPAIRLVVELDSIPGVGIDAARLICDKEKGMELSVYMDSCSDKPTQKLYLKNIDNLRAFEEKYQKFLKEHKYNTKDNKEDCVEEDTQQEF